jgi:hypothetical protein
MGFGDILSGTINTYKEHFNALLKPLLLLYFLPTAVFEIIAGLLAAAFLGGAVLSNFDITTLFAMGVTSLLFITFFGIVNAVLTAILVIAVIQIIVMKRNNEDISLGKIINNTMKFLGKYLVLNLVLVVALVLLALLLVVPAIIMGIYWSLAIYVLVLEDQGVFESMKKSKEMVTHRWWRTFGYSLLFMLILIGASFAAGIVIGLVSVPLALLPFIGPFVSNILNQLLTTFFFPLGIIFYEKYYQALKAEKAK